ncbi:ABC transporter ATP-binding protein [Xenophilus sp. Marseille-Q4582]|uniref:ABC transporter ATP-binding protein n=1 Tax=Xenophilus sp. Marseille-Q4582 TaxID=2866600 RepID=UPI001CE41DA9|nr:ABC transporter ATP-binding protein [Xenophilus sp. Marseille-Q4582]
MSSVSTTRADTVLDIRDLRIEFPVYQGAVRALDGVSLQVGAGELVGVVGESGCGKSVTSMLALRLLPKGSYRVVSGQVGLLGHDALTASEATMRSLRGGRVSLVFQEPLTALNPTRRVGEQMLEVIRRHQKDQTPTAGTSPAGPPRGRMGLGAARRPMDKAAALAHAEQLLTDMRVADPAEVLRRYPFELSGGMRQRVLIALAFSGDPALIVADEPTTALDVTVQQQVLGLLRERARRSGTAVLLITHDMGVISQYTDRVYVMYAGRVVESGPTAQVLELPAHPYTRALLQALPEQAPPKSRLPAIAGGVPDLRHPPAGCAYQARCGQSLLRCDTRPAMASLSSVSSEASERRVACWLYTRQEQAA